MMGYKKYFFVISLAIFGLFSFAVAATEDEVVEEAVIEEEQGEETFWDNISGSIEHRLFPYFHSARGDRSVKNEFILELEVRDNIGENFEYLVVPRLIWDDNNSSSGYMNRVIDDDIRRNITDLKEWHVRFKSEHLMASLGKHIFSWGTADGFNPTDNLNPRDFTDFIENEKIGVPSLDLNYFNGNYRFEAVVIPVFTPSRLPLFGKRWSPIPQNFPLMINDRVLPSETMDNVQFASRISATLGGWDLSASYFNGFEYVPTGLISTPIPTSITPVYDEVSIYGADFSTTISTFEVHGEVAYYDRDDKDRNCYLQYILGFDRTIEDIISDHDLTITLEYAREETVRRADNPNRYIDFELSHVFKNSIMTKLVYEFDYFKKIEIAGIYNVNNKDYIIQPKFCYKPTDNWLIEVGLDILGGSSTSFFGRYSKNDRAFIKTKYSF